MSSSLIIRLVVICFQICTFEPLETATLNPVTFRILLWFAFKFVPLNHWKQHGVVKQRSGRRCDLLSNLYLWTIGNSTIDRCGSILLVVICFQICTFEPLETAMRRVYHIVHLLWFAFKFVPLNHWKQQNCNNFLFINDLCAVLERRKEPVSNNESRLNSGIHYSKRVLIAVLGSWVLSSSSHRIAQFGRIACL